MTGIQTVSNVTLHFGDCLSYMQGMADNSVDAVITDIPFNEVNRDSGGLRLLDKGVADSAEFDLDSTIKSGKGIALRFLRARTAFIYQKNSHRVRSFNTHYRLGKD